MEAKREELIDEIAAVTRGAKDEIYAIVEKGAKVQRKKESNLPLVRVPQFVSEIRDRFDEVLELVLDGKDLEKGERSRAFRLVKAALNDISTQQLPPLERRLKRPLKEKRIKLPGWPVAAPEKGDEKAARKRSGIRVLQRFYPQGGHKYRHPEYEEASFALLWQAYEATDRGIDYEATEEKINIPRIRERLQGIIAYIDNLEKGKTQRQRQRR